MVSHHNPPEWLNSVATCIATLVCRDRDLLGKQELSTQPQSLSGAGGALTPVGKLGGAVWRAAPCPPGMALGQGGGLGDLSLMYAGVRRQKVCLCKNLSGQNSLLHNGSSGSLASVFFPISLQERSIGFMQS